MADSLFLYLHGSQDNRTTLLKCFEFQVDNPTGVFSDVKRRAWNSLSMDERDRKIRLWNTKESQYKSVLKSRNRVLTRVNKSLKTLAQSEA